MLAAGDEMRRTQQGNNNAYCQDNELSWVKWDIGAEDRNFLAFVSGLIEFRKRHPSFRRRNFLQGRLIRGAGVKDIVWLTPDGREMTDQEWNQSYARCLGVYLEGQGTGEDERGRPMVDNDFTLLLNSHHETIPFRIPSLPTASSWRVVIDTSRNGTGEESNDGLFRSGENFQLKPRSLALFVRDIGAERKSHTETQDIRPKDIRPTGGDGVS